MNRLSKMIVISGGIFLFAISIDPMRVGGQTLTTVSPQNSKDQARLAVGIIRLINTAEVVDCRTKDGNMDTTIKFLSWDELLNAPCFQHAQSRVRSHMSGAPQPSFSPGPEIVPGLEQRLVVSPDGSHYNLWLGQTKEVQCGFAFYSDERGVIYEGAAIGCNPQGILGKP